RDKGRRTRDPGRGTRDLLRIVIAGGSGFLGSALAEVYAEEGHDVRVLTRSLAPGRSQHDSGTGVPGVTRVGWAPDGPAADAAKPAARRGVRIVLLRTGLVLEKSGGTLAKMITPFRWFAGGPLGSGRQYMSWIHRLDWIEMVRWIVQSPSVDGPVNATSPHPVTNAAFAKALGRALHRPAVLPAPAFALRLALGELADALLTGQRAIPARAQRGGFHFRYPEIDLALRGIFGE